MKRIKILTIRFSNPIRREEIPQFRGAVISTMSNANILFHNHLDDNNFRYSYPLIQYKRLNQCATIVCIGDGTEAIGEFFSSCNFDITLGERVLKLDVENISANTVLVQIWDDEFSYRIRNWLPLNQENYKVFCNTDSIAERCILLEKTLIGNILSLAKGLDIHFDKQVSLKITHIAEPKAIIYKGVRMMSFDAEFKTNVSLPNYIGLGKGVSLGYGMITRKGNKE